MGKESVIFGTGQRIGILWIIPETGKKHCFREYPSVQQEGIASMSKRHHLSEEERQFISSRLNGAKKLTEGSYRAVAGPYRKRFGRWVGRLVVTTILEEKVAKMSSASANGNGDGHARPKRKHTITRSIRRHPSLNRH